jgi:hypothetical protein
MIIALIVCGIYDPYPVDGVLVPLAAKLAREAFVAHLRK